MTHEEMMKKVDERINGFLKAVVESIRLTEAVKAKTPPSFSE